uniref:Putative secreted protein n=1 Tax=Amblyomma parvum TaxID=251391 RepID=A0A023G0Z4_AMBPA
MNNAVTLAFVSCCVAFAASQIRICPHQEHLSEELRNCHGPELKNNSVLEKLSKISQRYEELCAVKLMPGSTPTELWAQRCADKHFNTMFYGCWADMLSVDDLLNSSELDSRHLALYKKALECEFHVLGIGA